MHILRDTSSTGMGSRNKRTINIGSRDEGPTCILKIRGLDMYSIKIRVSTSRGCKSTAMMHDFGRVAS